MKASTVCIAISTVHQYDDCLDEACPLCQMAISSIISSSILSRPVRINASLMVEREF